jgi:hypothetical protein
VSVLLKHRGELPPALSSLDSLHFPRILLSSLLSENQKRKSITTLKNRFEDPAAPWNMQWHFSTAVLWLNQILFKNHLKSQKGRC